MNFNYDAYLEKEFAKMEAQQERLLKEVLCINCAYVLQPDVDDPEYAYCKYIDAYVYSDQHPCDNDCEDYSSFC